jgi:hypothetical protein
MALRPLYAPVQNRTITFMAGTTDAMVQEALALTKIPASEASIDRSNGDVVVTLSEKVTIPENQKIQVPEHLYTWVK